MRDLQIKLARLEENTSMNNSKNVSKQGYIQRCRWCDDASHTRKDCNEFNNMIRQGIICWKDGKIALKDREDLLQTNFGKGGMRALVQDYLKEHETTARESASYGARVDDEIGGSTKTSEFWASAVSTIQEGKLPREALFKTTAIIRGKTGWGDPVESLSVHAYIAQSQHEALMEEKRRGNFDDTREGNSSKRQIRGDKAREVASQELPVKDTSSSLGEKTKETKDKGKSIAYKLLSDIEAATNLKGVLEERILNAKQEFTLKEVLGIAKKEFHDVIIDSIKRKRQLMGETGMSHAIDARIYRDEEEVDIGYKQPTNEKNGYNQRVRFEDSSDKEIETLSHYTRKHWARATTEVLVKVGNIDEPIVVLVDHGSEINLMSKDLYKKQKWPIDMEHGWAIRAANNTRGELYGACPHAVLFSVPFQGTLFSVKRSLKGKNGGESFDGESQFWIQALTVGANPDPRWRIEEIQN
uniref:Predicted protein n=1 Tax=Physcomitrium patens TaxID=3218 RepID=A9U5L6_PHYPA